MPLNDPVPSNAPDVLLRNSQDFDKLMNDQGYHTNRVGNALPSYITAIEELGFDAPVLFAAGLSVDSSRKTVEYSGSRYFAKPSAVPFTTTATFDPNQWQMFDQQFAGAQIAQIGTYSLLRAYAGAATLVYVAGRTNDQDDAGGNFVKTNRVGALDNDGTIIVASNGDVWERQYSGAINVKWFGAKGDGTGNDATAIQAAINTTPENGGEVYIPEGRYRLTAQISLLNKRGVKITGAGMWGGSVANYQGTTSLLAVHSGAAIINMKGSNACELKDFSLEAENTTYPKTALALGRSSAASAGWHRIVRVSIFGYYSIAPFYNVASEENYFESLTIWLYGGGALYGVVGCPNDIFGVDGFVTSTNLVNTFVRLSVFNSVDNSSCACILLATDQQMGSWSFYGGYLIPRRGVYVRILNLGTNGSPLGPFIFSGTGGEILDPQSPYTNTPEAGFDLVSDVPCNLPGLTIEGARMQLINAGGTRKIIRQDANTTLVNPNIVLPPLEDPTIGVTVNRSKIKGGIFDVGTSSDWLSLTLQNGWVNAFGAPYAQAAYRVSPDGTTYCRGTLQGGTGVAFTLPLGSRPSGDTFFSTYAGGIVGRILVKSNGEVTVPVGALTQVDLSSIVIKP